MRTEDYSHEGAPSQSGPKSYPNRLVGSVAVDQEIECDIQGD